MGTVVEILVFLLAFAGLVCILSSLFRRYWPALSKKLFDRD